MNHFYSILGILLFQNPICPDTNLHRERFKTHWSGDKIIKESAKQLRLNLEEE